MIDPSHPFNHRTQQASEEARALEVTLQCNAALAFLKAEAWTEAAQHAGAALGKEPVRVGCDGWMDGWVGVVYVVFWGVSCRPTVDPSQPSPQPDH